jgi:beta-aspartyl-dipeptidase (metallo-type)
MFTIIENAELYAPAYLGKQAILVCGENVLKIGSVDTQAARSLGETILIDAAGCIVTPGFIDPHEHLLGGSGESGFASQTPEITLTEIVNAGVTTVVGCLGTDNTTKTPQGLLAKVKGLKEEGLSGFMWSGGYTVPPVCVTGSIRSDMMFVDEIIGAGEVAISDVRSSEPTAQEIARLASDVYSTGTLANKAGVVHVHVGELDSRLKIIRDCIDACGVKPEWFYLTHIERSEELMLQAIELAKNGCFVDIDTVEEDLSEKLTFYLDNLGWPEQLTVSSDASITSPRTLFSQIRSCIVDHGFAIENVLPLVTSNTANALKLKNKGKIAKGFVADLLVIEKDTFELRDVFCRGRLMMQEGKAVATEKFLKESNRNIELRGAHVR